MLFSPAKKLHPSVWNSLHFVHSFCIYTPGVPPTSSLLHALATTQPPCLFPLCSPPAQKEHCTTPLNLEPGLSHLNDTGCFGMSAANAVSCICTTILKIKPCELHLYTYIAYVPDALCRLQVHCVVSHYGTWAPMLMHNVWGLNNHSQTSQTGAQHLRPWCTRTTLVTTINRPQL